MTEDYKVDRFLSYPAEDAYKWYADKYCGVSVEALTDSQKKRAWEQYLMKKLMEKDDGKGTSDN